MLFDLLFIFIVLTTVVTLATAAVSTLRGRRQRAANLLVRYLAFAAIYLVALVVVSLVSPQRVLAVGEDRCFDDWCVAVENVTITPELGQGESLLRANGAFYVVTLRLSNRARGRDQRAGSAAIHLIDDLDRWHDASPRGQRAYVAQHGPVAPLTATIPLGQSLTTVQVFDLPMESHDVGLAVEHPVGFSPGRLIIGDEASLLHKPTIVRLE